jgi:hypothetical protein
VITLPPSRSTYITGEGTEHAYALGLSASVVGLAVYGAPRPSGGKVPVVMQDRTAQDWSGRRKSDPRLQFGKLPSDRELWMKIFRTAALLALLTGPAYAQVPHINLLPTETKSRSPEEIEKDKATDKAYRESLRKIPDAKVNDPWGNVRAPDSHKAVVQPKQRVKSGASTAR